MRIPARRRFIRASRLIAMLDRDRIRRFASLGFQSAHRSKDGSTVNMDSLTSPMGRGRLTRSSAGSSSNAESKPVCYSLTRSIARCIRSWFAVLDSSSLLRGNPGQLIFTTHESNLLTRPPPARRKYGSQRKTMNKLHAFTLLPIQGSK